MKHLSTILETKLYRDGNLLFHKENGPAIEYADGSASWYYHSNYVPVKSQKEYLQYLRLIIFL
jgi:hypothetical protein